MSDNTPATTKTAAPDLARTGEAEQQERAQRVAIEVRDCLGLDPLMPAEHGDLARMAVATTVLDITPADEIEGMMAAHIMASHVFAMNCFKSVNRATVDDRIRMQFLAQAGRLIALHGRQVDQLERRRETREFRVEEARRREVMARREADWARQEAELAAALGAGRDIPKPGAA